MNREDLHKAFQEYVAGYDANDPKIKLKISHSERVAGFCEMIARTEPLADPDFLWMIGLLHDIGRFEQVRRYGTFIDAESVDHAELGADLLLEEGLLEQLGWADMTESERHLLELSIRSHNKYRIPNNLTKEEQACCNILRDADKIDIFRVLNDTPMEEIYNVTAEELREAQVSDEVKACFMEHKTVLRDKKRTVVDNLVGHICMTFELVYPVSRQIARDQGYVDQLLQFRSDNEDTKKWFQYMRNQIWK